MTDPTSSTRPYLIRAIRDWAQDHGLTPHIMVDAAMEGVKVPHGFVENERIVLNVSDNATGDMEINNEWILFSARFGGVSHSIDVPIDAVIAVFARENGQGLSFETESLLRGSDSERGNNENDLNTAPTQRPKQKLKSVEDTGKAVKPMRLAKVELDNDVLADEQENPAEHDDTTPPSPGKSKRPHLKLVE